MPIMRWITGTSKSPQFQRSAGASGTERAADLRMIVIVSDIPVDIWRGLTSIGNARLATRQPWTCSPTERIERSFRRTRCSVSKVVTVAGVAMDSAAQDSSHAFAQFHDDLAPHGRDYEVSAIYPQAPGCHGP